MRSFLFLVPLFIATSAVADPCKAISDRGQLPAYLRPGATFSGPVVYVGDGDGLCVAASPGRERDPNTWVEVRIADFYADELSSPGGLEAKAALSQLAYGRRVTCSFQKRSYDRAVAVCSLDRKSLGDLLRARAIPEGGNGRGPRR